MKTNAKYIPISVFRMIQWPVLLVYVYCGWYDSVQYFLCCLHFGSISWILVSVLALVYITIYWKVFLRKETRLSTPSKGNWRCFLSNCAKVTLASALCGIILLETKVKSEPVIGAFSSNWGIKTYCLCAISLVLLNVCSEIWKLHTAKDKYNSFGMLLLIVAIYVCAVWLSVHSMHLLFRYSKWISSVWSSAWNFLGVIGNSQISWLSIGGTFFTGCLVVISWSKDQPCPQWNPFSARELGITLRIPFLSLSIWVCICYAAIYELDRLACLGCLLLLCSNIATLHYCHHLQNERHVMRRVINKLRWFNLPQIIERTSLCIESAANAEPREGQNDYSQEIDAIATFVLNCRRIATNMITHMRTEDKKSQVRIMSKLIDELFRLTSAEKDLKTLGFLLGMGCAPCDIDNEKEFSDYFYYISKLQSHLTLHTHEKHEDGFMSLPEDNVRNFYAYLQQGLLLSIFVLQLNVANRKEARLPIKDNKTNDIIEQVLREFLEKHQHSAPYDEEELRKIVLSMRLCAAQAISSSSGMSTVDDSIDVGPCQDELLCGLIERVYQ